MKTILSIFLAGAMLFVPVEIPNQQASGQVAGAILVMTIATVATCLILYVTRHGGPDSAWHYLVLEKSMDHVNWTPVVTNYLATKLDEAMPAFTAHKTDPIAFYRLREIKGPDSLVPFVPEIVPGRNEQPIIQ